MARIHHASLFGLRKDKYEFLNGNDVSTTEWTELSPQSPFYLFVPQNTDLREEYDEGWKVSDALPLNLLGFQTHRDKIAVGFTEELLREQVTEYLDRSPLSDHIKLCEYRPFDTRSVYLASNVTDRPRLEVMQHLFHSNLALNVVRQTKALQWQHAFVSDKPAPAVFIEIKDGSSVFPLYLYPTDNTKTNLFDEDTAPSTAQGGVRTLRRSSSPIWKRASA